ncbi:ABC transporter substrate-binding protein [uncultured Hydrogenophaga sp.]|uniref:ABC transporter substrate-binding protein n=1 Tax=uncultured Hydrogenophaga sp. TaxID=199683 RepID=UPI00265E0085|nr:ABC transporter substrate-binding protein [uncultured Hydrogenophaga sp.]
MAAPSGMPPVAIGATLPSRLTGRRRWLAGAALGAAALALPGCVRRPDLVRLACIDPLTGPAADVGRNSLRTWQFLSERLGAEANPAGLRFQVAGFDNKGSPQESLHALRAAIDQGFRVILQGNGSGVAATLAAAIERHNERFPERGVVFLNYAAMDPALTRERCSFWHFRIDPDTAMKTQAMATFLAQDTPWRRVALFNQNYAHGQQVSSWFRRKVDELGGGLQVVSDDLHPAFVMRDYIPWVRRLQASGAQVLVTGNWGVDLLRLIEAMQSEGLDMPVFGYYTHLSGVPTLLASGKRTMPVLQVGASHTNQPGPLAPLMQAFRARFRDDLVVTSAYDGLVLLAQAMARAGSSSATDLARQMSGMTFDGFDGPVTLRSGDHQLQKGLYINRWQRTDSVHPFGAEGTDHTFAPVRHFDGVAVSQPAQCGMVRR